MNETILRWKARIGALKPLAIIGLLITGVMLIVALILAAQVVKNPGGEPLPVTMAQIFNGEVGSGRYITVKGAPNYEAAYEMTEDGRLKAQYYFLIDRHSGNMVLVKSDRLYVEARMNSGKATTLTGMLQSTPTDLRKMMEEDLVEIRGYGFDANPRVYIDENARPVDALTVVLLGGISLPVLLLCVAVMFFPGVVFNTAPLDPYAQPPAKESKEAPYKAIGTFDRLASVRPTIVVGKGQQKFNRAVANFVPLTEQQVLVYIHHIVKSRYSTTESDWGVFLDTGNVVSIEPGKLYGWGDKPALRIRYHDAEHKEQTLLVQCKHTAAQAEAVRLLEQAGLRVRVPL